MALDMDALIAGIKGLQEKQSLADLLADPFGRGLAAATVALLFILLRLIFPGKQEKSELDKALQAKPKPPPRGYTRAEVAQHASEDDLWLIIKNKGAEQYKVYDVTSYLEHHPGGDAILTNAGADCTRGFLGVQHPPTVFDLVNEYEIGWLLEEGQEEGNQEGQEGGVNKEL